MALPPLVLRLLALLLVFAVPLPAKPAEPYDLYALLSLTGPGAFVGKDDEQVLSVAETVINRSGGIRGRPVRFVIQDDGSNPATALQLANLLFAKGVPVVLGPSFAATCSSVIPVVLNGPVVYCLSPSLHPPPGSYAFSAGVSTNDISLVVLRYLRARGWKRFALLVTTDVSGQDGEQLILKHLTEPANKDLQLVVNEHYNVSDLTVTAQMSRIKAASPQALIAWATGTPFGTALRGVIDAGMDIPVMGNAGDANGVQLDQYKSFMPKVLLAPAFLYLAHTTLAPGPIRNAQNVFFGAMNAQGFQPDGTAGIGWDATFIIVDALRHLGTDATARQVHDYIEHLHGFSGVNGTYDFRDGSQRGLTIDATIVVRWDPTTREFTPLTKPGGALLGNPAP